MVTVGNEMPCRITKQDNIMPAEIGDELVTALGNMPTTLQRKLLNGIRSDKGKENVQDTPEKT